VKYLIDTNVISEIRKGNRCDARVARWFSGVGDDELYLSVMALGEIRQGIERLRTRDPQRSKVLENWLNEVIESFGPRILPVDGAVAGAWGHLSAVGSFPVVDALLAATAQTHGLTLVTRNVQDIAGTGVSCLNPFEFDA
jgi:predicted nucleic acid-binding protein